MPTKHEEEFEALIEAESRRGNVDPETLRESFDIGMLVGFALSVSERPMNIEAVSKVASEMISSFKSEKIRTIVAEHKRA